MSTLTSFTSEMSHALLTLGFYFLLRALLVHTLDNLLLSPSLPSSLSIIPSIVPPPPSVGLFVGMSQGNSFK